MCSKNVTSLCVNVVFFVTMKMFPVYLQWFYYHLNLIVRCYCPMFNVQMLKIQMLNLMSMFKFTLSKNVALSIPFILEELKPMWNIGHYFIYS